MECITPVSPPMTNMAMNPTEKNSGVFSLIDPPHNVPIQLKILTPVGTAMSIVDIANAEFAAVPKPVVNMWCAHTPQLMNAMAMPEMTTNGYPNSGFRENVGSTSETIPVAGRMRMYTSGWANSQNMCCQSSGLPPSAGLKKLAPNSRSNMSWNRPTVITGKAKTIRNEVTSVIQTNSGMRNKLIPGARMLRMVTRKLKPEAMEETQRISRPSSQ